MSDLGHEFVSRHIAKDDSSFASMYKPYDGQAFRHICLVRSCMSPLTCGGLESVLALSFGLKATGYAQVVSCQCSLTSLGPA